MAKYVSITGSIICSDFQALLIKDALSKNNLQTKFTLSQEQRDLYLKGWIFPDIIINWMRYVFFGADVQEYAVDFIKEQILLVIEVIKGQGDKEENSIDGFFYITPEDSNNSYCWIIRDNKLFEDQLLRVNNDNVSK